MRRSKDHAGSTPATGTNFSENLMKSKPQIVVQKKQPFLCLDHGVRYGADDLMCPKCEREICEAHDATICSCGKREINKCSKENGLGTGKMCFK